MAYAGIEHRFTRRGLHPLPRNFRLQNPFPSNVNRRHFQRCSNKKSPAHTQRWFGHHWTPAIEATRILKTPFPEVSWAAAKLCFRCLQRIRPAFCAIRFSSARQCLGLSNDLQRGWQLCGEMPFLFPLFLRRRNRSRTSPGELGPYALAPKPTPIRRRHILSCAGRCESHRRSECPKYRIPLIAESRPRASFRFWGSGCCSRTVLGPAKPLLLPLTQRSASRLHRDRTPLDRARC